MSHSLVVKLNSLIFLLTKIWQNEYLTKNGTESVNETNLGSSSMDWGRNFSTPSGNAFDSFERKAQTWTHEIIHICAYNTKLYILTKSECSTSLIFYENTNKLHIMTSETEEKEIKVQRLHSGGVNLKLLLSGRESVCQWWIRPGIAAPSPPAEFWQQTTQNHLTS